MRSPMQAILTGLALSLAAGCAGNGAYSTPERMDNGLVIILPGIEGESSFNRDIRRGLENTALRRAVPIRPWGAQVPLFGMIVNQTNFLGNRAIGASIAKEIVAYQKEYPGRPVHVIGHSGGGGIAVFVAEGMPEGHQLDGLVLLSASISSGHDLTKALTHCKNGIINYYVPGDPLLSGGTALMGNVDGVHGPGAGLNGFSTPGEKATPEQKLAYAKLYQIRLRPEMVNGNGVGHTTGTDQDFVYYHIAPWVFSSLWPPVEAQAYMGN
ncbi:MAG: alpha/beta hydrolase [Planctomycetota bacterium]|nr:alpha/beta hydrolase [Planctomycetota bacterium]